MWLCYLMASIPVFIGAVLWIVSKRVVWWEWLLMSGVGVLVSVVFHVIAVTSMGADVETWSGKITHAIYEPEWVEKYKEAIYKNITKTRTVRDSKGRSRTERYTDRVFSHYEDRYRTHPEEWTAYLNYGSVNSNTGISRDFYHEIKRSFGDKEDKRHGNKSGFHRGDPNIYQVNNHTGYIYPATMSKLWDNRVKAAPSVFSYEKVKEGTAVFEYPENSNWRVSDRVVGEAKKYFSVHHWDCMNTRLGPSKKVNVIIVGFVSSDSKLAHLQEAKWIGGKKNDVVICFGGVTEENKSSYVYVFGWTEKLIAKRNIETILLNNKLSNDLIPQIEEEIRNNYVIKDWSKFDYITVEPPFWSYVVLLLVMFAVQGGLIWFALTNRKDK